MAVFKNPAHSFFMHSANAVDCFLKFIGIYLNCYKTNGKFYLQVLINKIDIHISGKDLHIISNLEI
jgi:hypothetical protein